MELIFEWDEDKAQENLQKHGIAFEEAKTVFNDPFLITFFDDEHSDAEDRYISIGVASNRKVLLVVHTERGKFVIRLISCRKATLSERRVYEEGKDQN